jgi:hypothetical protein
MTAERMHEIGFSRAAKVEVRMPPTQSLVAGDRFPSFT